MLSGKKSMVESYLQTARDTRCAHNTMLADEERPELGWVQCHPEGILKVPAAQAAFT